MEEKRIKVLEKALNIIKSVLEKARRGTRNPSRKPITPKKARPAKIAKRGSVRHKKVIPANKGITSFWRSEDPIEEVEVAKNGQWSIEKTDDQRFHVHAWDQKKGVGSKYTTTPRTRQEILDHPSFNPDGKHTDWNSLQSHLRQNGMIAQIHKPKK